MKSYLSNYVRKNKCTLLAVGPMSRSCVDASIELSNDYLFPIMLISSRRQIDSEEFNGGYVNNWTTENFSKYVRLKDKKKTIILCRDHGGPWQNNIEIKKKYNLKEALNSAKQSFKNDIDSKFKIIHIDTSIDIHNKKYSEKEMLRRLFDLYSFCCEYSFKKNKKIFIEIGTEEQTGFTNTKDQLENHLIQIKRFCKKNNYPEPIFVVVQTGTKVMEMKNVGSFDSPLRIKNQLPSEIQVPIMVDVCEKNDVMIKQHNTDYLSDDALKWHPRLGIHAANVAPEFGIAETIEFIKILKQNNLKKLADKFLELSYKSHKWEKWILEKSKASDYEKSLIAGHYVFSTPTFIEIKNKASLILGKKGIDIDLYLKKSIKKNIIRYLRLFRLI